MLDGKRNPSSLVNEFCSFLGVMPLISNQALKSPATVQGYGFNTVFANFDGERFCDKEGNKRRGKTKKTE